MISGSDLSGKYYYDRALQQIHTVCTRSHRRLEHCMTLSRSFSLRVWLEHAVPVWRNQHKMLTEINNYHQYQRQQRQREHYYNLLTLHSTQGTGSIGGSMWILSVVLTWQCKREREAWDDLPADGHDCRREIGLCNVNKMGCLNACLCYKCEWISCDN